MMLDYTKTALDHTIIGYKRETNVIITSGKDERNLDLHHNSMFCNLVLGLIPCIIVDLFHSTAS